MLTCAAPRGIEDHFGGPKGRNGIANGNPTEEHPTVSTTPPITSTDGVDSSQKTTEEAPVTPAISSDPNSDHDAEEYLYYEIKKRIFFERNLNFSDIKYVLSQKDKDRFMYALTDKLGYMSEGRKPNDPHLPVIRSHRDKLIELLEKMAAKKEPKPPVSQGGPSDETSASKEPPSPSYINKIGYEVSADIRDLGPDAIQDILSELTFPDALGYAVGIKLGYSQGDKHMKYLQNANADELKEVLQQTLQLKTTRKTLLDDSFDSSRSEPTPIPPTTKPASKEPPSPSDINKIAFEVSIDIHDLSPDAIRRILSELTFSDALGYAVGSNLGYSQGDEHMKFLEHADADKLKIILQRTLESKTTSKTIPDDSFDSSRSEPTPIPPTTKPANKEPPSPSDINKIAFEVSVDIRDRLGPDAIRRILSELTFSDALGYAVGIKLGYSQGDEHMKFLERADADELKIILQRTLESKTTSKTIPNEPKQPNEPTDLQSTKAPSANTKLDKSKPGDGDGAWPADYANRVGSVLTDTSAPDDGGLELILKIDESERVNLLNSKGFQNYLSKIHSKLYQQFMMEEADPNEIDLALEEYLEWPSQGSDFMEDERGGGDEPEAEEGETVRRIDVHVCVPQV